MESYCKILIIDDEFIMRQGMKHMLDWEKEGFQVVGEATNGQEGLALVEELHPNLVLADIVMPVVDGIEFSKIMKARYPDIQLIILSSYDKFEYVKETLLNGAVDYILKPALSPESLLKTLTRAANNIPGFQLNRHRETSCKNMLGRVLSSFDEELDETAFREIFPHNQFRILGLELKRLCGSRKLRMAKIEGETLEILKEQDCGNYLSMLVEERMLCIILNYRQKDQKKILDGVEICAAKMGNLYEEFFFVESRGFGKIGELKKRYETDIKENINLKFYYPNRHLMTAEEEENLSVEKFSYETYTANLSRKQFQAALNRFEEYIRYCCDMRMDEYRVKNLAKNLLYNFLVEIEKHRIQVDSLRQLYFRNIDEAPDVKAFLSEIEQEKQYLEKLVRDNIKMEDQKISEIREYIYEHYSEELDLTDLAHVFGFSYHYLSSYFNQYAKEGFSEYLNKIRIEKACELLREKKYSIAEISHRVGYQDHSYFCRVFKRIIGDTPTDYRRKAQRNEG